MSKNKFNKPGASIPWIASFVVLDLYVNLLPRLNFGLNLQHWLFYWGGFFLLLILVVRFVLPVKSIGQLGLKLHQRWSRNLWSGFLIGFTMYGLKYLIYFLTGKFAIEGIASFKHIIEVLLLGFISMFFSSLLNDILIRGFWLPFFQKKKMMIGYMLATVLLYAADDLWNEGFDLFNLVFSAILGLSLSYTVLITRSVWMSFGIHWGLNMMFRILNGFDGTGVLKLHNLDGGRLYDYLNLVLTALIFPVVYILLQQNKFKRRTSKMRAFRHKY